MQLPQKEALKEIGRWAAIYGVSFVVSWFITETLRQIGAVPEFLTLNVWVFTYLLPVREVLATALTLLGRFLDKYLHELGKVTDNLKLMGGLTRF